MTRSAAWVQALQISKAGTRLFCFSHAGGGASSFHSWNGALGPLVQVSAVCLPGREARLSEPLFFEFDSLLDAMSEAISVSADIPFAVFGHSMGALLAFEWVRRLEQKSGRGPVCLFVSGRKAPDIASDTSPMHALGDREFLHELRERYRGMPQELLDMPELVEVYLPILRADIAVVESYQFREAPPLRCPILAFAGVQDATVTYEELLAWKRHTTGNFAAHLLPGGHFYAQGPLLQKISQTLSGSRS